MDDPLNETNEKTACEDAEEEKARLSRKIESLEKSLHTEKERADKCLANWQRAQADYLNLKRRSEQERIEQSAYANAVLMGELLPILDDLDRALASIPGEAVGSTWVEGVKLIGKKLKTVLQSQGLVEIDALGKDFDTNVHEAIAYVEGEEGKVVEEAQKGYKLRDRVIRPSRVKVGKGSEEAKAGSDAAE